MRRRDLWNAFVALLLAQASLFGAWMPPSNPGVRIIPDVSGTWRIDSSNEGEFTLESSENYKAGPGDAFELDVRIRVEVKTKALPELVCYDRAGREIPIASALVTGPTGYTTDWLHYRRVFPTRPRTASVRARIRAQAKAMFGSQT